MEATVKFVVDQNLSTTSLCDSECVYTAKVLSRTEKTVIIEVRGKAERRKVYVTAEGVEYIFPFGQYSMAPTFRADRGH